MMRKPTHNYAWSHLTSDALDEPCSSYDLVDAFNLKDLDRVKRILAENPLALHQTAFLWDKATPRQDRKVSIASAAEAAVQMGWTAALEVLHEAGDRFDQPRAGGALGLATRKEYLPCIRALLRLGAPLNPNNAVAPILKLQNSSMIPNKIERTRKIGQAYIKAGQDPWQPSGGGTVLDGLMLNGCAGVVMDMLGEETNKGRQVPEGYDQSKFWQSFEEMVSFCVSCSTSRSVLSHKPVFVKIIELAKQTGITADCDTVLRLHSRCMKASTSNTRCSFDTLASTVVAISSLALLSGAPDARSLQALVDAVEPHREVVDAEVMAMLDHELMNASTPVAANSSKIPFMRF